MGKPKDSRLVKHRARSEARRQLRGQFLTGLSIPVIVPATGVPPPPPVPVPSISQPDALPPLPETATEEQRQVHAAGDYVARLVNREPRLTGLLAALVNFRRCAAVAYRELHAILEAQGDAPQLAADYVVLLALHEAAAPFSEHTLVQELTGLAMPWLAETIDSHTAQDEQDQLARAVLADAERRARPIDTGLAHSAVAPPHLARDRGLILVGTPDVTRAVIEAVIARLDAAESSRETIIRLCATAPRTPSGRYLINVTPDRWRGCADANDSMAKFFAREVASSCSTLPELLVCDDLTHAFTKAYVGRPAGSIASETYRRLEGWCKQRGVAFLGAVPVPEELDILPLEEFARLSAFADVALVRSRVFEGDLHEVSVGTGGTVLHLNLHPEPRIIHLGVSASWPSSTPAIAPDRPTLP